MFAVDRDQRRPAAPRRVHERRAAYDQRFLVREQHALARARGRERRGSPAAPTMAAITVSTSGSAATSAMPSGPQHPRGEPAGKRARASRAGADR